MTVNFPVTHDRRCVSVPLAHSNPGLANHHAERVRHYPPLAKLRWRLQALDPCNLGAASPTSQKMEDEEKKEKKKKWTNVRLIRTFSPKPWKSCNSHFLGRADLSIDPLSGGQWHSEIQWTG